jgi:dinuclear metal center YbgI/SA1388 family protein
MSGILDIITQFCDDRVKREEIPDFTGSENGLQIANNGDVTKIGASVDAGLDPFQKATTAGIDFLIVHHGLYWNPPIPLVDSSYKKIKMALDGNLAVYASHLPLDSHPEIGNNAILAHKLKLKPVGTFLPHEGVDIGLLAEGIDARKELVVRLKDLFPSGIKAIEFGSKNLEKIAVLTGSGQAAVGEVLAAGTDTLVTGELRQHHFNMAQELGLNLYACGHYATETFGVDALGQEVAKKFGLPYQFIDIECPL